MVDGTACGPYRVVVVVDDVLAVALPYEMENINQKQLLQYRDRML